MERERTRPGYRVRVAAMEAGTGMAAMERERGSAAPGAVGRDGAGTVRNRGGTGCSRVPATGRPAVPGAPSRDRAGPRLAGPAEHVCNKLC
jgi:hypothetical protein